MMKGSITRDQILSVLKLPSDANTSSAFEALGVDSWDLIELRAILETRFALVFSDEDWVNMNSPDDIARKTEEN
jgi:acyl carrier protein